MFPQFWKCPSELSVNFMYIVNDAQNSLSPTWSPALPNVLEDRDHPGDPSIKDSVTSGGSLSSWSNGSVLMIVCPGFYIIYQIVWNDRCATRSCKRQVWIFFSKFFSEALSQLHESFFFSRTIEWLSQSQRNSWCRNCGKFTVRTNFLSCSDCLS